MDLEKLKDLQQDLLGIIFLIVAEASEEEVRNMQDRAFKIIDELRDHINDDIEMNNNLRMTILDCIIFCDIHDGVRLNNRSLLNLEDAVKSIGGKTSQELGRRRPMTQQEMDDVLEHIARIAQVRMLFEELMESRAEFVSSMQEGQNRRLIEESREAIYRATLAISMTIGSRTHLGESGVGEIVVVTLGGLLSVPIVMLLAALTPISAGRGSGHITSREITTQEVVHSISEPMAGLSAALAGGTIMLLRSIVGSIAGINMEFGESLRSGLIAATGAGIGAALSTALARRMFTPVSTNLENAATEQPNVQGGQNR